MREVFSFWTGHPFDFELWVRTGYWVANGVSPYGVLPVVPGLSFADVYSSLGESTIGYLPFWPLILAGIYKVYVAVGFGNRFVYYFLLKQPIIIGDLLLGYTIFRYVRARRPETGEAMLSLWLLSPLTIIISSIWGMFDSLAMVCVVMALSVHRGTARSLWEALAIWIKSIPLIFAIPLAFSGSKSTRNLIISLALPAALSAAAVLLLGWPISSAIDTIESTATKGGQSLSVFGVLFFVSPFGQSSYPPLLLDALGLVWIPALLVATFFASRWFGFDTEKGLVQSLILCAAAFMLFKAQVNEQYSIYLLALILIDVGVWNPGRRRLYLAITTVVLVFLVVNNGFFIRFVSPIDPLAVFTESQLDSSLGSIRFDILFACSVAFAALNLAYIVALFRARRGAPQRTSPASS
ncbi:MAG: hypothetical protein OK456_00535 [Thaumarchaeota archaeon]|nr:hypothetical protein [Nitrososphaerota archaeon]